jgi:hypothetical protein
MRRATSFIGLILLALLVSGSSNVLAAALCPNMQALSCCPMKTEHDAAPSHEAMDGMSMDGAGVMPAVSVEAISIGQSATLCTHCFSPADPVIRSVVVANPAQTSKRNLSVPVLARVPSSPVVSDSSFASIVSSRQHAPPFASTSRHVLINIFLI